MEYLHLSGQTLKHPPSSSPLRPSLNTLLSRVLAHSPRLPSLLDDSKLFQRPVSMHPCKQFLGSQRPGKLSAYPGRETDTGGPKFVHGRGFIKPADEAGLAVAAPVETKDSSIGYVLCWLSCSSSKCDKIELFRCGFRISRP